MKQNKSHDFSKNLRFDHEHTFLSLQQGKNISKIINVDVIFTYCECDQSLSSLELTFNIIVLALIEWSEAIKGKKLYLGLKKLFRLLQLS